MKVLVVTHRPLYPPVYGFSKLILDTYTALSELGVSTYILSITPRQTRFIRTNRVIYREVVEPKIVFTKLLITRLLLRITRSELLFLHLINIYKTYSNNSMIPHIEKIVLNEFDKPDVIISETLYPFGLAYSLSIKYSIPSIIRTHNVEKQYISSLSRIFNKLAEKYIGELEKKILFQTNRVITISLLDKKYIEENYGLKNVEYIPPIIITRKHNESEKYLLKHGLERGKYFIYTASPHKPNIDFLKSIVKCISDLEQYGFKIVISGSISDIASKLIERTKSRNIVLTGIVTDEELYSLIKNSYASLAPHHGSGVPIKLIEPLIIGTPVITTWNVLNTLEDLRNCENIYAVKSISEICSALHELVVNREIYSRISENTKYFSQKLDYRINAEKFLSIIKNTIRSS